MYSRAFPDFAGTRAHPAPSTPVGAHRAPTRVEPESALSQAHVSRTPSEALSLASIRREPAATVPVAQMRRQLEALAQDHDPGPGSLARTQRPRCRSSLLPRPPRTPRRLPRDPPPSAPPAAPNPGGGCSGSGLAHAGPRPAPGTHRPSAAARGRGAPAAAAPGSWRPPCGGTSRRGSQPCSLCSPARCGARRAGRAPPRGGASAAPQPRLGGRGDR